MQTTCTSLQTDNHTNISSLNFYRPDVLPDAQTTVSKHWRTAGFCCAKFYCPYALTDGNQCIQIREKMLEFSSTVLSTLSLYVHYVLALQNLLKLTHGHYGHVWAWEHCRISPPRFLAEHCKRQLNQGGFVLLYFRLFTFFWFVLSLFNCIFLYCFLCQYQSSDWLWRLPPKWPILCPTPTHGRYAWLLFRFTRLLNDTCQRPSTCRATSHISWIRCLKKWWWKPVTRSTWQLPDLRSACCQHGVKYSLEVA